MRAFVIVPVIAAVGACVPPPVEVTRAGMTAYESPAWGVALEYPTDWKAAPGVEAAPVVFEARAPIRAETAGAGMSVVAAWSAAALDDACYAFKEKFPADATRPREAKVIIDGYPGRAFEYRERRDGLLVYNRAVLVKAPERIFIANFAAYEAQYENVEPVFRAIENSLKIR